MKTLIIIPARMASVRLPNKPLIMINDKPMVIWTTEQAVKADVGDVYIACDDDRVASLCDQYGYKYIMTDPDISTGSDRVFAASELLDEKYDYIVNVQGDMPKIHPTTIRLTVQSLIDNSKFDIMSAITEFSNEEEKQDINNVTAIVSHKSGALQLNDVANAMYFTRTSHPFPQSVYKHIGLYAYRADALKKFVSLPQSQLELEEQLEQLRALEHDMKIGCVFVNDHVISIDTHKDLILLNSSVI